MQSLNNRNNTYNNWMKIKIHRGLDQVGGCITEIWTETSRIFIDMGQNLPGIGETPDPVRDRAMVSALFSNNVRQNQAVVYSHAHGDHVGLFEYVPNGIPQIIGEGAKILLTIKYDTFLKGREYHLTDLVRMGADRNDIEELKLLLEEDAHRLAKIKKFRIWKRPSLDNCQKKGHFLKRLLQLWRKEEKSDFTIGDIKITPFPTCHSIYDSYMFLIEAEGKKIWHKPMPKTLTFLSRKEHCFCMKKIVLTSILFHFSCKRRWQKTNMSLSCPLQQI